MFMLKSSVACPLCLPVPRGSDRDKTADNQATADLQLTPSVCVDALHFQLSPPRLM